MQRDEEALGPLGPYSRIPDAAAFLTNSRIFHTLSSSTPGAILLAETHAKRAPRWKLEGPGISKQSLVAPVTLKVSFLHL